MSTMESPVQETVGEFVPGLDADAFARIAGEPELLQQKRARAFAAYAGLPLPTVRDEEWRRTDPALFPFERMTRLDNLPRVAFEGRDAWDEEFDVVVAIDEGGWSLDDLTGAIKAGRCSVRSLADAALQDPALVMQYWQGSALPLKPRKFTSLADALWNVGFVVRVPAKTVLEKGILFRYQNRRAGSLLIPRLVVIADEQSEIRVVEHFTSPAGITVGCLSAREFYAGPGAQVRAASVQEWGDDAYHVGEDWARVKRDGKIDWVTLTLGGKVSKMMVGCDVCQANAQAYLSGVFFAEGDQHFDQRTLQLHSSPDTYSNLLYKGAVKDRGHSVYQGVINAKPGAIRVDAYQMNNNLILSEGARADSLPGLEIDADDLKCSHGATSGTLDEEQLFYLRSRGLDLMEAKRLVVTGFFEDVINRVPYPFIQERLRQHIQQKIGA